LTKTTRSVILEGYIRVPSTGEPLTVGQLVPVEITLVSRQHQWKNRNERIVAMKQADPSLSCQSIAALMGVSRQRVHQILKVNGKTAKRRRRKIEHEPSEWDELGEM